MTTAPNKIKVFRQAKGWSLQQLAEATGTSKSQIDKLEKGQRRLSVDWMVRLAKPLGCDPRALLSLRPTEPDMGTPHPQPLAVYALIQTADNHLKRSPQATDQTQRPAFLQHAPDAYAIVVPDNAMTPMYRRGQTLFIHPHKPPAPGCGILISFKDGTTQLAAYLDETQQTLRFCTYGVTITEREESRSKIENIHRIVGTIDPT